MDSEHRHELTENDLASFFTHFGQWWAKWGNTLLILFVICTATFLIYRVWSGRIIAAHENAWTDLAIETSPAGYQAIANTYANPSVQVLAYLRGGDAALAQAMKSDTTQATPSSPEQAEDRLVQAKSLYEKVLTTTELVVYRSNAMLGLASVAEMRDDWDAAADYYRQVIDLADDHLPALTHQARTRLTLLPQLSEPIVFAPPAPPPAPTAKGDQPAIDIGNFDLPVVDLSNAPVDAAKDTSTP